VARDSGRAGRGWPLPPPETFVPALALAGAAALGLVLGSFLNVVILRLPAGRSVVTPRSACVGCGTLIRWFDNIPVLSWILLGGKCRACRMPISARYAVVELLTGALFTLAAWALLTRNDGQWREPAAWCRLAVAETYLAALVALSFIDLDHRILPDRITRPGMVAGPVLCALLAPGFQPVRLLPDLPVRGAALLLSLSGVLAGWGLIRLVAWAGEKAFRREAMGMGDSKLMGMIGGFLGPLAVPGVLAIASFLGSGIGLVAMAVTRDREIPFGPFLAAASVPLMLFPLEVVEMFVQVQEWIRGWMGG